MSDRDDSTDTITDCDELREALRYLRIDPESAYANDVRYALAFDGGALEGRATADCIRAMTLARSAVEAITQTTVAQTEADRDRALRAHARALDVLRGFGAANPLAKVEGGRRGLVALVRACLHMHLSGEGDGAEHFAELASRCDVAFAFLRRLVDCELDDAEALKADAHLDFVRETFDRQIGRPERGRGSRSPERVAAIVSRYFGAFGDAPREPEDVVTERFVDARKALKRQENK